MHPYLAILGLRIATYDVMQIAGFLLAAAYCFHAALGLKIERSRLITIIAIGFLVQFFGGMLIPFMYKSAVLGTSVTFEFWKYCSGRYFHSSFLAVLAYVLLVSKFLKWPVRKILDILVIAVMIMSSVGRIGCFLEGCCGGKPTNMPWAVHFPSNPAAGVHPTQIYMFFAELLILAMLAIINKNKRYDGQTFWCGVFLYSIYRFGVEFYRTNPIFMLGLTHAQYFSVLTFFLSILYLIRWGQTNGSR